MSGAVETADIPRESVGARARQVLRVGRIAGASASALTPRLLAGLTFASGAVLLLSDLTPAAQGRLLWMDRLVPLPLLEISHFAASLVGVGLLVLAHGLSRRLDAAYYCTIAALGAGIGASLLKGADYEEALLLTVVLGLVTASRSRFDRRASFFAARFSRGWIAAVSAVIASALWLGFMAFRHVEYGHELWWRVALDAEASRALRASLGIAISLLVVASLRLMRPPHPAMPAPSDDDLRDAADVIALQPRTMPHLVFLRDKSLLWNASRTAFLMYAVQGRTWVALGDPVGPEGEAPDLIRQFLERADDYDGVPVFYQVDSASLHLYADFGFSFVKLGEHARVRLETFNVDGSALRKLRHALTRLERDGGRFAILTAAEADARFDEIAAVSDEWIADKGTSEKGFSLGFFDREYLTHGPMAVIEREGRIEAFANLWLGSDHEELSVDLMRQRTGASKAAMDALFTHLMLWGREQGYRWMSLGVAPLAGLEPSTVSPYWTRLAVLLRRHGERFYNFHGVREYKDKFGPSWEPQYLAYPARRQSGRILADVAALVSGGYRQIIFK
jgi:phosphatidylglycerol lysyltransferase